MNTRWTVDERWTTCARLLCGRESQPPRLDPCPVQHVTSTSRCWRLWRARRSAARPVPTFPRPWMSLRRLTNVLGVTREQADLPAEQPASCQDPRLPAAYEHARRSRDPRRSSPQGPLRALCLTVLPAAHRLRRSADFGRTVRQGVRAGRSTMVVHLLSPAERDEPTMVGFVVSKAVGNSVHRNLVKRRLRGSMAGRIDRVPTGSSVVVRALPAAAAASFADLERDLDSCLARVLRGDATRARR